MVLWTAGNCSAASAVQARKVTLPVYTAGQSNAVAALKVDRLFTEQRRLGFFRIKLLQVLVADGARLEVRETAPRTHWLARLPSSLESFAGKVPVEFRNFELRLPGETTPRLRASRVNLNSGPGAAWLQFRDVVVQTPGPPLKVSHARLPLDGGPAELAWESHGAVIRCDFLTGHCRTNQLNLTAKSP